jgi:anti-sigma B factor antagonist
MPSAQRVRVEEREGVRVLSFLERRLFDDAIVRDAGDQMLAAVPRAKPCPVVVDFSGVDLLSSSMLVKFVVLLRQMEAIQQPLRLCEMNNTLRQVFRTSNLDRLFPIDRDLSESLAAARPAAPGA